VPHCRGSQTAPAHVYLLGTHIQLLALVGHAGPTHQPLMPAYFFHVTLELYPSRSSPDKTFTPPPHTDIFASELPVHRRASWGSYPPAARTYSSSLKPVASGSEASQATTSRERPVTSRRFSHRTRPSFSDQHDSPVPVVKPPKRPGHRRTQSFAHRDWRFDTISILSIDMHPSHGTELDQPRAKSLKHPSQPPNAGGLATKGNFVPSDPKDTEVGWGVVHLYRDGQETPGLYDDVEGASKDFNEEDCTTLCILAVPSYMTPSDFLGFMGEQTREEVSHFRLIRTSRANKYMVLMKFREAKKAREWRKAWDGKAFNSMEVISMQWIAVKQRHTDRNSQNIVTSSLSSRSTSRTATRIEILPPTPTLQMTPSRPPRQNNRLPLSRQRLVSLRLLTAHR